MKTKKSSSSIDEVINRLLESKEKSEKHIQELKEQLYGNIDPKTGKEYFKPQVNKIPSYLVHSKVNNEIFKFIII